jgi:chitin disaccharide deacetylase
LENVSRTADREIRSEDNRANGALIINADDWGLDRETTDRIWDCVARKTVSSTSAMVFMEDSARAAAIARERAVPTGIHLNFTEPFTGSNLPSKVVDNHQRVAAYLRRRRINQAVFHPGLRQAFEYITKAQLEEYGRLYGELPQRIDGHHHMHLAANVVFDSLLPAETFVRRNFSFESGEKGFINRVYRRFVDRKIARRHAVSDYFFGLIPLKPAERLSRIFSLARNFVVEVETHPIRQEEFNFLNEGELLRWAGDYPKPGHAPRRARGD